MKQTFLKVMPWVFEEEGGYVDHPKDPGGATNLAWSALIFGAR